MGVSSVTTSREVNDQRQAGHFLVRSVASGVWNVSVVRRPGAWQLGQFIRAPNKQQHRAKQAANNAGNKGKSAQKIKLINHDNCTPKSPAATAHKAVM